MNKIIHLVFFSLTLFACEAPIKEKKENKKETEVIEPILLDKAALSGLGLKSVTNASQPNRKLFQKNLFRGSEISVYVVSSETATANWDNYGIDEFIYVINGRARLHPRSGTENFYYPGDFFVAPKGYTGIWETQGGTEFYHELSVIATKRPEEKVDSLQQPYFLDKMKIAGRGITPKETSIDLEAYQDILYKGAELDVHIVAESAQHKIISQPSKEQLIYVIAGSLSLKPKGGTKQTFFAGDFLVLPKGFTGEWESKGHHLFRSLRVYKSDMKLKGAVFFTIL